MSYSARRFAVLVGLVGISGFSQGLLLPLISIIFEQNGVSSSLNGFHATALYIGILIVSPFLEPPLRKYGYKPVILLGGAVVFIALFSFTLWESMWFWFALRLLIGIGDNILHFGTQTWITTTTPDHKRGTYIAIYGLMFGLGFTIGPLFTQLVAIHQNLPFIVSSVLCLFVWIFMFWIKNDYPVDETEMDISSSNTLARFTNATKIAWIALLGPFAYGFLETVLHSIFPIYAMRIGYDVALISIIVPCFAGAGIISQIPLGAFSDRIGRKKMLTIVLSSGTAIFFAGTWFDQYLIGLFATFILAGLLLGSLFSLGIAYMTDLLPRMLLPAGNILCGVAFSIGSITGPILGGFYLDYFANQSFFLMLALFMAAVSIMMYFFGPKKKPNNA
ncbi:MULTISPECIES: MFS transporter [Allobacillus]|uniref:MFS transporter n=1 Tax=Allobacillus salarius TaxID=1955272 RepID=A0A556PP94_9BACI|nr:MFS transporter [Allobacillus salarius]TSJ66198.1 MFS transporter [Allobacillus salarius]